MHLIKLSYKTIEGIFAGFWGLTIIDLLPLFSTDFLGSVDGVIKTLMALTGLFYFVLKGWHIHQMHKLERDAKKIDNNKKREELESMEIDNEKKTEI